MEAYNKAVTSPEPSRAGVEAALFGTFATNGEVTTISEKAKAKTAKDAKGISEISERAKAVKPNAGETEPKPGAKEAAAKPGAAETPPKRNAAKAKRPPKLKELTAQALCCLSEMMADESNKPADRLNAVKTVLDYAGKLPQSDDGTLRVVFQGIDPEYTE